MFGDVIGFTRVGVTGTTFTTPVATRTFTPTDRLGIAVPVCDVHTFINSGFPWTLTFNGTYVVGGGAFTKTVTIPTNAHGGYYDWHLIDLDITSDVILTSVTHANIRNFANGDVILIRRVTPDAFPALSSLTELTYVGLSTPTTYFALDKATVNFLNPVNIKFRFVGTMGEKIRVSFFDYNRYDGYRKVNIEMKSGENFDYDAFAIKDITVTQLSGTISGTFYVYASNSQMSILKSLFTETTLNTPLSNITPSFTPIPAPTVLNKAHGTLVEGIGFNIPTTPTPWTAQQFAFKINGASSNVNINPNKLGYSTFLSVGTSAVNTNIFSEVKTNNNISTLGDVKVTRLLAYAPPVQTQPIPFQQIYDIDGGIDIHLPYFFSSPVGLSLSYNVITTGNSNGILTLNGGMLNVKPSIPKIGMHSATIEVSDGITTITTTYLFEIISTDGYRYIYDAETEKCAFINTETETAWHAVGWFDAPSSGLFDPWSIHLKCLELPGENVILSKDFIEKSPNLSLEYYII